MQLQPPISLEQMIDQMATGKAFDLEYVTVNRKKGTGGEKKSVAQAMLTSQHLKAFDQVKGTIKKITGSLAKKDPRYINIYIPSHTASEGRFRDVRVRLITKFNGRKVS